MEPGSRIVTEVEFREAGSEERRGWIEAARKEFQESFLEMQDPIADDLNPPDDEDFEPLPELEDFDPLPDDVPELEYFDEVSTE